MKAAGFVGLTLDTGALLALDRAGRQDEVLDQVRRVRRGGGTICIPTEVVAQAWRSARQIELARLLKTDIDFAVMSVETARKVGRLCASSGHADVVDVHVALCAQERHHAVMTSDPEDIARVDPRLPLIRV